MEQAETTAPTPDGVQADSAQGESNRARVRRLLLDPLGFRFPRGVDEAAQRRFLDTVADEAAHLTDADLSVVLGMLKTRGGGKDRNLWPDMATVRGFAHLVRPRPLTAEPALLRWFASVEGPRAIAEGTLVETAEYFARHHAPPVTEGARARVRAQAEENARRLRIVAEKRAKGFPVADMEADWALDYRRRLAGWDEVVRLERDRKGAA
jgi:hypothetical protein